MSGELVEKCGDQSVTCRCGFMGTICDLNNVYPDISVIPMEGSPIPAGDCPVCAKPVLHTTQSDYQEFFSVFLNCKVGEPNELLDKHPWV